MKAVDKKEGSVQATARGHEPPAPCTQDLGAGECPGLGSEVRRGWVCPVSVTLQV